ncbi:NUDIX domain-containing protein [Riemerella columbipharyngis]|uniref:NUDIX domain-containing protein n=1 Tax=Riemerella columbipharyngis TaxID=1071918 RepID=A0A1G7A7J4_9FLAO|nr:NUDIX hydrolase [Riemerella columbipharyngis]SDE10789.1 NUDIX domain-containing protein [Riemerella columbipharyngis]
MDINRINIRVYGICLNGYKEMMVLDEIYVGRQLIKLPGGGLEYGEGLHDCLHREFREELNLSITIKEHFYTQEDFLVSKFRNNEQLLTVYYIVEVEDLSMLKIVESSIKQVLWKSLEGDNPFTLPIDRRVFQLLKERFNP